MGVSFDDVTLPQAIAVGEELAKGPGCAYVVTPNPEIVNMARQDPAYGAILNGAGLVLPDGIGVVHAAKILGTPLQGRVPGIDFATGLVARMAEMRDYGSAFMKGAPLAFVVLGDTSKSDLWRENAAISATLLQLACVDEGLGSCWVHINGRPRRKDEPDGQSAADYLRSFLPVPADCEPLCAIAAGYSDFTPAPLPDADDAARIIRL